MSKTGTGSDFAWIGELDANGTGWFELKKTYEKKVIDKPSSFHEYINKNLCMEGYTMSTLVEIAAQVVSAHASNSAMTTDELLAEISKVYAALKDLDASELTEGAVEKRPPLTVKDAFRKNEIICLECGKGGFKTLSRHLRTTHNMKPKEYRRKHGIDTKQSLAARSFSEARRQMAAEKGLAENLAKAREIRAAKLKAKKAPATKQRAVKAKVEQPALLPTGTE